MIKIQLPTPVTIKKNYSWHAMKGMPGVH